MNITYGVVPIVAGLDKFTNILTQWTQYLAANERAMIHMSPESFMKVVGVIEIVAGLLVFVKPVIGGFVVMAWLIAIALALIIGGGYFDVAVRDLVMAIGAFTMVQLTMITKKTLG